jgi:hypothetical protein
MEMSRQLHSQAALSTGNMYPRYQLYRSLGGPQCRSGRGGEERNPALAGSRTPAVQCVGQIQAELDE